MISEFSGNPNGSCAQTIERLGHSWKTFVDIRQSKLLQSSIFFLSQKIGSIPKKNEQVRSVLTEKWLISKRVDGGSIAGSGGAKVCEYWLLITFQSLQVLKHSFETCRKIHLEVWHLRHIGWWLLWRKGRQREELSACFGKAAVVDFCLQSHIPKVRN